MNTEQMLEKIVEAMAKANSPLIENVTVTFARGRAFNNFYIVTKDGYEYVGKGCGKKGNLRSLYSDYCC